MNEIADNLSSPAWWVSAVFAGVAASLLAAYAKPLIDKVGSKLSIYLRNRNQAKKNVFDEHVLSLRAHPERQILEAIEVNYLRLRGIYYFLMGIVCMIALGFSAGVDSVPKWLLLLTGLMFLFTTSSSVIDMRLAQELRTVIDASKEE